MSLTVGDGFKLGCGAVLALALSLAVLILISAVAMLIANLLGVRLPLPGYSA